MDQHSEIESGLLLRGIDPTSGRWVLGILACGLLLAAAAGLAYLFYGHQLIAAGYRGDFSGPLEAYFASKRDRPLQFWLDRGDAWALIGLLEVLLATVALAALVLYRRSVAQVFRGHVAAAAAPPARPAEGARRGIDYAACALLVAGSMALYLVLGAALARMPLYLTYGDLFFDADHLEAVTGWTQWRTETFHKGVHPLVLLLVVPLGTLATSIVGDPVLALRIITAAIAASTVGLCYWTTCRLVPRPAAAALSLLLALSGNHLITGSVPEVFALSSLGVVASVLLLWKSLHDGRVYFRWWILVALLCFAVVISNLVIPLVCLAILAWRLRLREGPLPYLLTLSLVVAGLALPLSILQRLLFPSADLFFLPLTIVKEVIFVHVTILSDPLLVLRELASNVFLASVSLPEPEVIVRVRSGTPSLSYYEAPLRWLAVALPGAVLWSALLLAAIARTLARRQLHPVALAALLVLAFNLVLHSFFGVDTIFVYSSHYTFPLIAFVALGLMDWQRWMPAAFALVAVLVGIGNVATILDFPSKL